MLNPSRILALMAVTGTVTLLTGAATAQDDNAQQTNSGTSSALCRVAIFAVRLCSATSSMPRPTAGEAHTPAWVRWAAKTGFDGVKFFNLHPPEVTRAAIDEARKLHMGTIAHLSQPGVARFNALDAGRAGLGTVTHFYGHFEALLKDHRVQTVSSNYNYLDEQARFLVGQDAHLPTISTIFRAA